MSYFFYPQPLYDYNVPQYKSIQINKQVQDNMRILDCILRTMSTAENLSGVDYKSKRYNLDKKDISYIKNPEEIRDDFLMNIQCLRSLLNIYKKRYPNQQPQIYEPYKKEDLKYDLGSYRKIVVKKNPDLDKYFQDFESLLDCKNCQIYSEKEMLSSYKKPEKTNEKKINKVARNIMRQGEKEKKRIEKAMKKYVESGKVELAENDGEHDEEDNSDSNEEDGDINMAGQ